LFSHISRRNCFLKHGIEEKIQGNIKGREDEEEDVEVPNE
jgi:hypothetical protein